MGIGLALVMRLALLSLIYVVVSLTRPVLSIGDLAFSWRDIILNAGGLFLVWKATTEIHHNVDPDPGPDMFDGGKPALGFSAAIVHILLLDLVFSIDSIITAVGMSDDIPVMIVAVIVAVLVMLLAAVVVIYLFRLLIALWSRP